MYSHPESDIMKLTFYIKLMHFLLECPPPSGEVGYVSFGAVLSVIEVNTIFSYLSLIVRKPVFEVSDKARVKPVSSATETS